MLFVHIKRPYCHLKVFFVLFDVEFVRRVRFVRLAFFKFYTLESGHVARIGITLRFHTKRRLIAVNLFAYDAVKEVACVKLHTRSIGKYAHFYAALFAFCGCDFSETCAV